MQRLKLLVTGVAVAFLLMVPRAASAGMGEVIDIIIGLTGPQMIGVPIKCELNLESRATTCYAAGIRIPRAERKVDDDFWTARRFWASLGGGVYFSTTKDSDMRNFDAFAIQMFALEPTVNYRLGRLRGGSNFAYEVGAGPTMMFFHSRDFESFFNWGIKTTPAALTWRNVSSHNLIFHFAYNLRVFPDAFTAEDFGGTTSTHTGREIAHGVTFGIGF